MDLFKLRNALLTVVPEVYHFAAPPQTNGSYIVWAEDGFNSFQSDDKSEDFCYTGTIDYFTPQEYDGNIKKIQDALNKADISFRVNSIQREGDTGMIHYEWVFELG